MTTATTARAVVSPPLQERSRATYNRILDALEDLLREHRFEDITIRALVYRSGSSTGSFYARFPTKDTLLPALYARYDQQLHTLSPWSGRSAADASLEEVVSVICGRVISRLRRRRWLTRAVALHARLHPELIPDDVRDRRSALHAEWRSLLLAHRGRMRHPDPESAVALGLFMIVTTCREKIVFADAPHASSFEVSDKELAAEMERALLSYLGCS
jgi:AcrR family transcriptional regulator